MNTTDLTLVWVRRSRLIVFDNGFDLETEIPANIRMPGDLPPSTSTYTQQVIVDEVPKNSASTSGMCPFSIV